MPSRAVLQACRIASSGSRLCATRALSAQASGTLSAHFEKSVSEFGLENALRVEDEDLAVTYDELQGHVNAFARGLAELGFRQGDTFLARLPSCSEQVVLTLAAAKIGAKFAPLPADASAETVRAALSAQNTKAVLFARDTRSLDFAYAALPEIEGHSRAEHLEIDDFPNLRYVFHGSHKLLDGMTRFRDVAVYGPVERDLIVALSAQCSASTPLYTQMGKHGESVSVLTHGEMSSRAAEAAKRLGLVSTDRVLVHADLTQAQGLVCGPLASLLTGAEVVSPGGYNGSAESALMLAEDAKATAAVLAGNDLNELSRATCPCMYLAMMELYLRWDPPSRRLPGDALSSANVSQLSRVLVIGDGGMKAKRLSRNVLNVKDDERGAQISLPPAAE